MKKLLFILMLFATGALHSQILDTLRIDTCFNIAFNKTQIDYYYLEKKGRDIKLVRSSKVVGFPFVSKDYNGFFGSQEETIIVTDKTGKKKDGNKDTITIQKPDGSVNYLLINSYHKIALMEDLVRSQKYIIPNGNNWFLDHNSAGKAFRAVILGSAGKIIAELSNHQIDSIGVSFIQMDKDSNVVVYQTKNAKTTPQVIEFCLYPSGNRAFERIKFNDSTTVSIYYFPNGNKKMISKLEFIVEKVENLPEFSDGITEVSRTIEKRTLRIYDENGDTIVDEVVE